MHSAKGLTGPLILLAAAAALAQDRPLASLPEKEARRTLTSTRVQGQVGGSLDLRVRGTDRSYNYKLRATWITPEVAEAAGRLLMTDRGLAEAQAREVIRAVAAAGWLILVEIDPREGSGVIPNDWLSRFGQAGSDRKVVGRVLAPEGAWKSLLSAFPRDYAWDLFLVEFPRQLEDGAPVFAQPGPDAELIVRIRDKQGRVRWKSATP
jgi:hypothetical protein